MLNAQFCVIRNASCDVGVWMNASQTSATPATFWWHRKSIFLQLCPFMALPSIRYIIADPSRHSPVHKCVNEQDVGTTTSSTLSHMSISMKNWHWNRLRSGVCLNFYEQQCELNWKNVELVWWQIVEDFSPFRSTESVIEFSELIIKLPCARDVNECQLYGSGGIWRLCRFHFHCHGCCLHSFHYHN